LRSMGIVAVATTATATLRVATGWTTSSKWWTLLSHVVCSYRNVRLLFNTVGKTRIRRQSDGWRNVSTREESLLSWNRVGLITEVEIVTDKLEY
jgi:hypothetical protein